MELKDFFIGESFELNWDFILELPHFCDMENTQQNPRWHSEGSALEHTKLVCKNMLKFMEEDMEKCLHEKRLMMLSALFHDIGKPKTTFKGEKDGNWHSYGHESVGSKLTREMLWDWPIYDREYIAHMVKWHMEPLFFERAKNPRDVVDKITKTLPYYDIYRLKMCDLEGAIQKPNCSTKEEDRKILERFLNIGKELNNISWLNMFKIGESPYGCSGSLPKFAEDAVAVNVMIGLPGSGKNTFIDNVLLGKMDNPVVLSRDELGYCSENEKIVGTNKQESKVTKIFNERLLDAVNNNIPVVLNNINLSAKRRKALKGFLGGKKIRWNYWYVEAPTLKDNFKRRKGQISEKVFYNMIQNFDFPEHNEYHSLWVIKQK